MHILFGTYLDFLDNRKKPYYISFFQLKKYKCAACGYSCYLKTDLERHINNVHDKHRSPCPICGKKYSDLRQHVRIVHEGAKVRRCLYLRITFSTQFVLSSGRMPALQRKILQSQSTYP